MRTLGRDLFPKNGLVFQEAFDILEQIQKNVYDRYILVDLTNSALSHNLRIRSNLFDPESEMFIFTI